MPHTLRLDQPAVWLHDVVRPAVDHFTAAPLDMGRAYVALTMVYDFHKRLFHHLGGRHSRFEGATLESFRKDLAGANGAFLALEAALDPRTERSLRYTNILSPGALMTLLSHPSKVRRSVVVASVNRQLLPMLDELMALYEEWLALYGAKTT